MNESNYVLRGKLLRHLRKRKGLSAKDVAKELNVSENTIYQYEKGKIKNISNENLKLLAGILDISPQALYDVENLTDYKKYLLNDFPIAHEEVKFDNFEVIDSEKSKYLHPASIPVYGSVPAGKPVEAFQNKIKELPLALSDKELKKTYFGLVVHGDSMYPNYMEGDIAVIEATSDFNSGDDVVAYIGDDFEATLKRIHRRGDKIILQPLNEQYRPREFDKDSAQLTVVGVVRKLVREYS